MRLHWRTTAAVDVPGRGVGAEVGDGGAPWRRRGGNCGPCKGLDTPTPRQRTLVWSSAPF